MKLHAINRTSAADSSLSVNINRYNYFLKIWHYHPELELVFIKESTGTRFIGDSISKFSTGDVILLGENLPHLWLSDEHYFDSDSTLIAESIAIHFKKDFLGAKFLRAPELKFISALLDQSQFGIYFLNIETEILEKIQSLSSLTGYDRLMKFLEVLKDLSHHKKYELICSQGYRNTFQNSGNKKLDMVYNYIFENFKTKISLKDVANIAHMNSSAFSRYFKNIHRKTFTRYINEIRIGYACKLIMENSNSISSACYEAGYNNISNFNRQFKSIVGMSPTQYIKLHS